MTDNIHSDIMIETEGLSKYYGDFIAVEDLTFSIKRGEVVAFLGPNGAGKTTFIKYIINSLQKANKQKISEVTSPTFTVINEYQIKKNSFHSINLTTNFLLEKSA